MTEPTQDEVNQVLERWDATRPALQGRILIRLLEKLARYQNALEEIARKPGDGSPQLLAREVLEKE